jgi:hypothetical protein
MNDQRKKKNVLPLAASRRRANRVVPVKDGE